MVHGVAEPRAAYVCVQLQTPSSANPELVAHGYICPAGGGRHYMRYTQLIFDERCTSNIYIVWTVSENPGEMQENR